MPSFDLSEVVRFRSDLDIHSWHLARPEGWNFRWKLWSCQLPNRQWCWPGDSQLVRDRHCLHFRPKKNGTITPPLPLRTAEGQEQCPGNMQLEEVCQHALGLHGFRMTQVKVCVSHDSSSPKMPSASASMMSKAAFGHLVLLKLLANAGHIHSYRFPQVPCIPSF